MPAKLGASPLKLSKTPWNSYRPHTVPQFQLKGQSCGFPDPRLLHLPPSTLPYPSASTGAAVWSEGEPLCPAVGQAVCPSCDLSLGSLHPGCRGCRALSLQLRCVLVFSFPRCSSSEKPTELIIHIHCPSPSDTDGSFQVDPTVLVAYPKRV